MAKVLDPYLAPPAQVRQHQLDELLSAAALKKRDKVIDNAGVTACCVSLVALLMGGALSTVASTWPGFMALCIVVAMTGLYGFVYDRECRAVALLQEERAAIVVTAHATTPHSYNALQHLADALNALDDDERLELRPLWEEAVKANAYLLERPDHEASYARIVARLDAARKVLHAHRAIAKAERKLAHEERKRELEARAPLPTDDDLLLANHAAQALSEGGRAYRELTER